jgi:hypothetical protein
MGRACSTNGSKDAYRILVDNIKMDLRKTGQGGMDWINLAKDRDQWRALVNMVMNIRFHKILGSS